MNVAAFDLDRTRRDLAVTSRLAYLNTGTAGPLPTPAAEAMAAAAQAEVEDGRIALGGFQRLFERVDLVRQGFAGLLKADADEFAFTHNTTEGMNIGTWGLDWRPGDEVVTTSLEHAGGLLPLYQIHRRHGVRVTFANCGTGGRDEVLDALQSCIRPGVKLVSLSHVSYQTGAVLPLAEIVAMAHSIGALVLVDGAQSVGAIPLDLHALGVDMYAFPGQKWLCGPEGTGGLYVAHAVQERVQPTYVGGFGLDHEHFSATDPEFSFRPGARRYEVGSVYRPAVEGLLAALRWVAEQGDTFAAIEAAATYCVQRVRQLSGVRVLTPVSDGVAGLVSFQVPGIDNQRCLEALSEAGVAIRQIPDNGALRASCGFFNSPAEIDRLVEVVASQPRG